MHTKAMGVHYTWQNTVYISDDKRIQTSALAGVAQWIECQPLNQRVANWIPSQGTSLGCRPGPQLGAHKGQPHIDVSLHFFLPPSPSL